MVASQKLTKEQFFQAMAAMISAKNWAGYLSFRRQFRETHPAGFAGSLRAFYCSLSPDDLAAYVKYFGDWELINKNQRRARKKEAATSDRACAHGK